MPRKTELAITPQFLEKRIYVVRGQRVMLDSDLARLYDVTVGALNQAVKRNPARFPEDFAFRLTPQEVANLKSQIVISSWGGRRSAPWAFSEQAAAGENLQEGIALTWPVITALLVAAVVAFGLGYCFLFSGDQIEHRHVAFDIAPDGQQIVFASADGDLYLFHLQNLRVVRLTTTARKEQTPACSPDGKSIVFAAEGSKGSCLFVCSIDGQQMRQLTADPESSDSMPSYSRDGSWIVFARAHRHRPYSLGGWTWDDWNVYVVKSDGTELRRVTHNKYYGLRSPRFLLDDKVVIYSADGDRVQTELGHSVFEVDIKGDQPPKLLTRNRPVRAKGGAWGSDPGVSADGDLISFISDRAVPFAYDIFVMNRDGTKSRPLGMTSVSKYNQSPRFLPDGRSILFLAGTEWNAGSRPIFSLWQVDSDGKNPRRIAESGLFTTPHQWKPRP